MRGGGGEGGGGGRACRAMVGVVEGSTPYVDEQEFPGIGRLMHITQVGVQVDMRPGGDPTKELAHETRSSSQNFYGAVRESAVANVACGRATALPKEQAGQVPGLRMSPVGVVEEGNNTCLASVFLCKWRSALSHLTGGSLREKALGDRRE